MAGFDQAWTAIANPRDGEAVSAQLRPLLRSAYLELQADPVQLDQLTKSLQELLTFLAAEGRTNANCWAADLFFCNCKEWERDWGNCDLPEMVHDVIAMMGEALHDTVLAPDVAENFGCLPEQLLARVRSWSSTSIGGAPKPQP